MSFAEIDKKSLLRIVFNTLQQYETTLNDKRMKYIFEQNWVSLFIISNKFFYLFGENYIPNF